MLETLPTGVLAVAVGLGVLRFGLLPWLIRLFWRAPRRAETLSPADFRLPFREVRVPTARNKQLHAWWIEVKPGAPTVVMLHGWGGNVQVMLPLAQIFAASGINALLLDARNHGRSDSDGFSSMVKFAEDLDYGIAWLRQQPGTESAPVAVLGHSVGAAAALLCASRRDDLAAVTSIASFAHPREIMAQMMSARGVPYVPFGWWSLRYIERAIGARYEEIAPVRTITRIKVPVLLVHGTEDRTVPVDDARAIHERRRDEQTRLLIVPGGHFNIGAIQSHGGQIVAFFMTAFTAFGRRESGGAAAQISGSA